MKKRELLKWLYELEDACVTGSPLNILSDETTEVNCWEIENCTKKRCPAYGRSDVRCWHVHGTFCALHKRSKAFSQKWEDCRECTVFKLATPNPESRIKELLNNIVAAFNCSELTALSDLRFLKSCVGDCAAKYALTTREIEVLSLALERLSTAKIAKNLGLAKETVKMHLKNLHRKMGVQTRDELISRLKEFAALRKTSVL